VASSDDTILAAQKAINSLLPELIHQQGLLRGWKISILESRNALTAQHALRRRSSLPMSERVRKRLEVLPPGIEIDFQSLEGAWKRSGKRGWKRLEILSIVQSLRIPGPNSCQDIDPPSGAFPGHPGSILEIFQTPRSASTPTQKEGRRTISTQFQEAGSGRRRDGRDKLLG
jgi:hypothetical protein